MPDWLLLPGIIVGLVSTLLLVMVNKSYYYFGADLVMYRESAQALRDGKPLYGVFFTGHLPFTSPPITAVFMQPTTWVTFDQANKAMLALIVAGTFVALLFATRMLGHIGLAGRIGIASVVGAIALWTEPFQTTLLNGQLNVIMLLLILGDMALADRNRFKGIGIGLAAALKLIPALFIVYLLLTRRFRAAVTAMVTFVVLTAVGWLANPKASSTFWFHGGLDSRKVLTDPRYWGEQALQGTVARLLDSTEQGGLPWLAAAAVVGLAGLALAVWAQRRGYEGIGVVTTAFVALMVSPTSWSHYWVWVAPLMLVLADVAIRNPGWTRNIAAGLAAACVVPFVSWPTNPPVVGPKGPVGLIWTIQFDSPLTQELAQDAYTITVLALFAIGALWLFVSRPRTAPVAVREESVSEEPAKEIQPVPQ
jgi:alpha-1,2-mannosyltransferase